MPELHANAIRTFYQRYAAYLESFGPGEGYLRKKVETELGSRMIYLKMRCCGLGAEWGKVLKLVALFSMPQTLLRDLAELYYCMLAKLCTLQYLICP